LDLEMKAIESSPRGRVFEDYRHWVMVPSDDERHEIKANKAIIAAGFDNDFYRSFSSDMIGSWLKGDLKGIGGMVKVKKELIPYYGVEEVPKRLVYLKNKRMIVEIFTEKITENLHPSGTKVVAIRFDKDKADSKKDINDLRKFFLGAKK